MGKKASTDGFRPRRATRYTGDTTLPHPVIADRTPHGLQPNGASQQASTLSSSGKGLTRAEIDESLNSIAPDEKQVIKQRKSRGPRRAIKRLLLAIVVICIAIGIAIAVRAVMAGLSVFKGDLLGIVQARPLKEDANGRSNILVFGTSDDDPEHEGALLTDSIMVLSVNQKKHDAYMVSIPRDLWVKYGTACNSGYEGKINEVFQCFSDDGADNEAGSVALAKKVSDVTGLDIQYRVHLNYTVVRQAVDAVGGVDVNVQGEGPVPYGVKPGSILDRNFDWRCNYKCYYVKYEPGVHHMDGEHALAFMRARNAAGGYGLPQANFNREQNQQKVIMALREKSMSAGTLANPVKVVNLIAALGDNLKTNFETPEIRTLMTIASDMQTSGMVSINLVDEKEPIMMNGNVGGASIVRPVAGLYDYTSVATYIKKQMSSDPAAREEASIVVLNGSGVAGAAQVAADKLAAEGLTIAAVDNAPAGTYKRREVYARDESSNPATRKKLESIYHTTITTGVEKFGVSADVDFVIVVGQADVSSQ